MASTKITLTTNDHAFEIDIKNVIAYLALGLALLLIFGLWPLVVFSLFAVAGYLLDWDWNCFGDDDTGEPKRKRKNSELIAEERDNGREEEQRCHRKT